MKTVLALATLLGATLLCAGQVHATTIRTTSGYGTGLDNTVITDSIVDPLEPILIGGTQYGEEVISSTLTSDVKFSTTGTTTATFDSSFEDDPFVLLFITPPWAPTGPSSIPLDIPGFTAQESGGDFNYGVFACSPDSNLNPDFTLCSNLSTACLDDLDSGSATTGSGPSVSIDIPASCSGQTLYFYFEDAQDPLGSSGSGPTETPEPGSLGLLAMGLLPLTYFSRRRLRA